MNQSISNKRAVHTSVQSNQIRITVSGRNETELKACLLLSIRSNNHFV